MDADQLACMVVAGNTTMLHLFHGVDPSSLGVAPFTPVFLEHRVVEGSSMRLVARGAAADRGASRTRAGAGEGKGNWSMPVHTLPGAAAYVGADVTAGVLASGMVYSPDTSLLVDLGTNGEIVLRTEAGCSAAPPLPGRRSKGPG